MPKCKERLTHIVRNSWDKVVQEYNEMKDVVKSEINLERVTFVFYEKKKNMKNMGEYYFK